jgi:hypothetical protein
LTAVAGLGSFDVFIGSRAARCGLVGLGPVGDSALGQDIGDISRFISDISIFVLGSTAFFGIVDCVGAMGVAVSVGVSAVAVATMAVVVEKEKADNVGGETETSYNQNKLRVADFLWLNETLDGLEEDGKA